MLISGAAMFVKYCKFCSKPAAVRIRYSGLLVCKDHFTEYFEKRVLRTIQKYKMIKEGDKVLLGVSGGKDSVTLLHLLANFQNVLKFEIIPLFIDLGIQPNNYSQISVKVVEENCKSLGLDANIVKIQDEYGLSIDKILTEKLKRPMCSVCGLIKRYVLNRKAIEFSADKVATGHNLDDEATVLLQNLINSDIYVLSKFGPVQPSFENVLVSRIKPFFETYEDEISLYANFKNLNYVDVICPYSEDAPLLKLKAIIKKLEDIRPGSALTMVRGFYKKIKPSLQTIREEKIKKCKICGMATSTDICSFCRLRQRIIKQSLSKNTS